MHVAEPDLNGEFAARFASAGQIHIAAHGTNMGVVQISVAMAQVQRAESLGDQHLNLLAQQLTRRITECLAQT